MKSDKRVMIYKIGYLTIDDGPTKDFTRKINILVSRNIPAIFFCIGKHLEKRPDEVINAIRKGYVIANHSYSHPSFSAIPLTQCYEEIEKTDEIITQLYNEAGYPRPGKFFRFPKGNKGTQEVGDFFDIMTPKTQKGITRKQSIQSYLRRLGYTQPPFGNITYRYYKEAGLLTDVDCLWTYDCMEFAVLKDEPLYGIDSLEKVLMRMDEDEPEGYRGLNDDGSDDIILLHDMEGTEDMFIPIIDRLLTKSIIFKLPDLPIQQEQVKS